jgi:hypothetical protein
MEYNNLTTPVAFFIFNRPQTTIRVFEEIKKAKPSTLLIIADGPRENRPGEAHLCDEVKRIVQNVDWECEVLRNYSSVNLGCKRRISSGLNWVFENVEEAIILEDDCLPSQSFFWYCQETLKKYRHEDSIMHISGDNMQFNSTNQTFSAYFSKFVNVWGWATWRRAWLCYDIEMKNWPQRRELLVEIVDNSWYRELISDAYDKTKKGEIDTWDYQWQFSVQVNDGYSVVPKVNLVSNIGFGENATHTRRQSKYANTNRGDIQLPISFPLEIRQDKLKDNKEATIYVKQFSWLGYLPFWVFRVIRAVYRKTWKKILGT